MLLPLACSIDNNVEKITTTDPVFPDLVVNPLEVNFGFLDAGTQGEQVVTLSNEGADTLDIKNIEIEGLAFSLISGDVIDTLEPGESSELILSYDPVNIEDTGWLKIDSNDPVDERSLEECDPRVQVG